MQDIEYILIEGYGLPFIKNTFINRIIPDLTNRILLC